MDALQTTIPSADTKNLFLASQGPISQHGEGHVIEVIQEALTEEVQQRFGMTVQPAVFTVCLDDIVMCAYTHCKNRT